MYSWIVCAYIDFSMWSIMELDNYIWHKNFSYPTTVNYKALKKEFEKISKLKENLDTLETEKTQLKRINQELREESRKCCNFVAHIQQSYTIKEKDAILDNGQRRKKLKSIHK